MADKGEGGGIVGDVELAVSDFFIGGSGEGVLEGLGGFRGPEGVAVEVV